MAKGRRTYKRDSKGRFAPTAGGVRAKGLLRTAAKPSSGGMLRLRAPLPVAQRGLSDRMKIELADYKAGNYKAINTYTRSGRAPDGVRTKSMDAQIRSMDAAMNRGRTTKGTVVYRGIQVPNADKVAASLVGKTITASSFQSTSRRRSAAQSFAGMGNSAMVFEIKVPKGTRALNMDKFASGTSRGEREILLGRGGQLTVTGARRQGLQTVVTATWADPAATKPRRRRK